jgi:hypothetical protein
MDVVRFEGQELADLIERLRNIEIEHRMGNVSSVSVAVDGGFKLKVVGPEFSSTWTPPLGTVS